MILVSALVPQLAGAQQSKSDQNVEFKSHLYIQGAGGVGYTVGETSFKNLLSPALAGSLGWQFSPAVGARLTGSGIQGKGYAVSATGEGYAFNYLEGALDVTLNLANLFGYDHSRLFNPYVFVGGGAILGFNNGAASTKTVVPSQYFGYLWNGKTLLYPAGRAGLGTDIRLSDILALTLEGNMNVITDKFNSKKAGNPDYQYNVLAGLKVNFGKPYNKVEKPDVDEAAARAAAEAARLAAEKAAAEKAAAEKAAAEKAAAEAAAKAAAEKAAAEKAARDAAMQKVCTFFELNKSEILPEEAAKLNDYVQWLKENPAVQILATGYADVQTGNHRYNKGLSKRRAEAVKAFLTEAGIDASRIETDYKGDTVQPFEVNEQNRVVISLVK